MNNIFRLAVFLFLATSTATIKAQKLPDLKGLGNQVQNGISNGTSNLSNDEVIGGLKEALQVGTKKTVERASLQNGFFKNPSIKIPFPPEAKKMESTLKGAGMSKQVDKFVETLNRAAEDASKSITPVFVDAITKMSIADGMNILKGSNDAATNYLRDKTTADLTQKIRPIISASLQKVQITKYWNPLVKKYNAMPMVQKVNPNLDDFVTERTLVGLFKLLAEEEGKIRKDPAARVSDLLKKVFGSL
jgi:hypothetical protein